MIFLKRYWILCIILLIAGFARFFFFQTVPPSLGWDGKSIGYDAWSVSIDGRDQWGNFLPVVFKSFGEFKSPVHSYTIVLAFVCFGLSFFSYNAAKLFIPLFLVVLGVTYINQLIQNKILLIVCCLVFGLFLLPVFISKDLNGSVRFSQVDVSEDL